MRTYCYLLILLFVSEIATAQFPFKPADLADASLPLWAREMYSKHPNVLKAEALLESYSKTHPKEKTRHTAYYNQWRKYIQPYVQEDGSVKFPNLTERKAFQEQTQKLSQSAAGKALASWNFAGPEKNFRARYDAADPVQQISWHANMYCIDQSISNPNTLYAGGENGGVYKSIDKGLHWVYMSLNEDMTTVSSIAVNPSDENDVLVNADNQTYHSFDGGISWGSPIPAVSNMNVLQFMYNPANTQMVFAGTNDGLYRSLNGGNTWSQVYTGECQSVAIQPGNPAVVFALQYDAGSKIATFYKSLDSGVTFTQKPNGWFSVPPVDAGLIQSYGGRIAITEADPSRVYVLLVGESQAAAQLQLHGQIGIYRSDDAGENWSHPHGLIGAPYNVATHPNMMTFAGDNNTYNQIYYNTTLVASQLDANKILIGGMSMWQSTDSAITYQPVGGYVGPIPFIHPDNQEFKIYKTSPTSEEIWFANDGGINYSTDFVATQESRSNGLYGSAFWGFDQGWNDDIMVGGRYHNGNSARRDGYPQGAFQQLGGGEAATGYVNYSNEKKTYYSDINGIVLPDTLNGLASRFPVNEDPNESYVDNSSSRILFDWDYWNVAYLGKDNRIYKSTNGGSSFGELYTFGTVSGNKIYWMEQSRVNTNLICAQQVINNISVLWKSLDRGVSWTLITLPQNKRELNFTLSYSNSNELWISFPQGNNGSKVYHSVNGGMSWTNITTPTLNGFQIDVMCHQFGTDGGVYLGTYHGPVLYRNNALSDWQVVGTNLPYISYPLRLVPFYRDNKLRLATWHLGIWENQLYEPSSLVADFSANFQAFYCPGDTIRFVPHCVASANATYQWAFPGATPPTSTVMYPEVIYAVNGSYDVTLIVTDNGISDTLTKTGFVKTVSNAALPLQENFESGSFASDWKLQGTATAASNWALTAAAGGFGNSTHSMKYDNYNYDAQGARDIIWTGKYDFTNVQNAKLFFDVAYARYNATYSDSLEIEVSTDCGVSFTSVYLKGGLGLATAPQNSTSEFVPTATQWRTDTVDVTAFAGNNEVLFSFESLGHFGQIIYIDNINLGGSFTGLNEQAASFYVSASPNPVQSELTIHSSSNINELKIVDVLGKTIIKRSYSPSSTVKLETSSLTTGVYSLEVRSGNKKSVVKFVKQ